MAEFELLIEVSSSKCFEGFQNVYKHSSKELSCDMKFSIFFPSTASVPGTKLPVVYYLSGITCNGEKMILKSGFQRYAEQYKLIVVCPDTSPISYLYCDWAVDGSWDFGNGSGFYVDATQAPYNKNYRMYSYVTKELRDVVEKNFSCVDGTRAGITGHSTGGHGALVCFLRNPQIYKAVSAFVPISDPTKSDWGKRIMTAYLGADEAAWKEYDATELVGRQPQKSVKILMEQGEDDKWMTSLKPLNFVEACKAIGQPLEYNSREGYDHGYHFVSTFIGNHLEHFSKILHH